MRRRRTILLGFGAAAAFAVSAATTTAHPSDPAHLAYETHDAEQFKTLSIERSHRRSPRALISLPPNKAGAFEAGDLVVAQGEYEATICLKAGRTQPQQPCVGKVYGYSPKLTGQVFVSPSKRARDRRAVAVSARHTFECSQQIPNRNRHCLIQVPPSKKRLEAPCSPCYVHLIVSASHSRAKDGHKVVMGSHDDNLSIFQNRAGLSMLRLRRTQMPEPESTHQVLSTIDVKPESREGPRKSVYSLPIRNPRAGDTYWVESQVVVKVGHLSHNVAMRNEVLLGEKASSNEPTGVYNAVEYPVVSPRNGWSCTRGPSAHESPCVVEKGGVIRFDRDREETYHLNVTLGASAVLLDGQRYRGGNVRLGKGFLRIYKFENTI
jgi:hypothetical protein